MQFFGGWEHLLTLFPMGEVDQTMPGGKSGHWDLLHDTVQAAPKGQHSKKSVLLFGNIVLFSMRYYVRMASLWLRWLPKALRLASKAAAVPYRIVHA